MKRFIRPAEPFRFGNDRLAARAFLELYNVTPYPKLIDEVDEGDALLSLEVPSDYDKLRVVRYIRPLAVAITRIALKQSERGVSIPAREILIEHKLEDGVLVPRKKGAAFVRSSLSEKMKLFADGTEETPEDAFVRALREEFGIEVAKEVIKLENPIDTYIEYAAHQVNQELDINVHESEKFPGVVTHSTLTRKSWLMPDAIGEQRIYQPEGYRDKQTGNVFTWLSIEECNRLLKD